MVDFVPSTNELKKLKFLCPGPKNSTFGAMRSVTRQTIKVERFEVSDEKAVDDPKGIKRCTLRYFNHWGLCRSYCGY